MNLLRTAKLKAGLVYLPKKLKQVLKQIDLRTCYSSTIYNSHMVKTTQMCIKGRMDKQIMVYICSGILCSDEKEKYGDTLQLA